MKKQMKFLAFLLFANFVLWGYADTPATAPQTPSVLGITVRSFSSGAYNQGIAVDSSGNLWIVSTGARERRFWTYGKGADGYNLTKVVMNPGPQSIMEVNASGAIVKTIPALSGALPFLSAGLGLQNNLVGPYSIAIDANNNLWLPIVINGENMQCGGWFRTDCYDNAEIYLIEKDASGKLLGSFFAANGYTDEWVPQMAFDSKQNIVLTATSDFAGKGDVVKIDPSGALAGVYNISNRVYAIALDKDGNIWGSNSNRDEITEMSPSGSVMKTLNIRHHSTGIAIDPNGNLWVGVNSHEIEKISPDGDVLAKTRVKNNTGDGPDKIKIDQAGTVWALNQSSNPNQGSDIVELDSSGNILATYPMPYATDFAIDKSGNVWVVNALYTGNNLYEIAGAAAGPEYSAGK